MKINIKSLLTGTTLVVASVPGIDAVPPKGIGLIDGATITHPVFGEMKVISHKEDLDFYHQKVKGTNGGPSDAKLLMENFIKYVLNADSMKEANIPQEDIEKFVVEACNSQAGMATLKVITANYMREYDRIKQFCKDHQAELRACYDFSRTEEGKEFCEKERQIFELEEKLKELFNRKIDPFRNSSPKIEISSRKDLLNLYNHFQKEKNLCDKELKLFCESLSSISSIDTDDYHTFLALYTFFLQDGETDKKDCRTYIKVGNRRIKYGSDEYNGLQGLCSQFKKQLERFFNIGDLCLSEKTLKRGSKEEERTRCCYLKYEDDLKALSDLCDKRSAQQIDSVKKLAQAYREETKKENEKKFSCIRRSVMPACYFSILYRHFFVKNDSEYADIKAVNKFLYRALKLVNDDEFCNFTAATLSIGLRTKAVNFENYHIYSNGSYFDFKSDRYSSLLHELMHFMNAIDCFETADGGEVSLDICKTGIIKNTKVVSKLELSEEEIDLEDSEEYDKKLEDVRHNLAETLGRLYAGNLETWTMYGIFICKGKQNPLKYEFYYDPLNEAVADSECKIICRKKKQVVRTGHSIFSDKEGIETLNEKIGIYDFYFRENETLRELIGK